MKSGIELITEERKRQQEVLGYDSTSKDKSEFYEDEQLVHAALAYINDDAEGYWPWNWCSPFKPTTRVRDLVKAAAMIAAEIDRLQSLTPCDQPSKSDAI